MVKIFVGELEQLDEFRLNLIDVNGLCLDKYITEGNPNELNAIKNDGFAAAAINALSAETNDQFIFAPITTESSSTSYDATTETTEATTAPITTESSSTSYSTTTETTESATDPATTNSSSTEPATSTTQNSTETDLTLTSELIESTTDYRTTTYYYPPVMPSTIILTPDENSIFKRFYFVYNYIYLSVLIIFGLTISIVFLFVKPRITN